MSDQHAQTPDPLRPAPTASDRAERDAALSAPMSPGFPASSTSPASPASPGSGGGEVADSWRAQPQESYEQAHSGGWGGPERHDMTGPIPKLRHEPREAGGEATASDSDPRLSTDAGYRTGREAATDADFGTGRKVSTDGEFGTDGNVRTDAGATTPEIDTASEARSTSGADRPRAGSNRPAADTPATGTPPVSWATHDLRDPEPPAAPPAPAATGLPLGRRSLGFRRRVTGALAPITMWIVVAYLVVDYMRTIYLATTAAALGGATHDLGAVVVLVIAGLLKVVALGCLARLALEACVNLAALAGERR